MRYTIKINHDKKYISYSHSGLIERKEIGEVWIQLINMKEFRQEKYNLLSDFRGAKFDFCAKELSVIELFLDSIRIILDGKRNAVIVDTPYETVISMLFENSLSKKMNFHVKTFSTLDSAIDFLM